MAALYALNLVLSSSSSSTCRYPTGRGAIATTLRLPKMNGIKAQLTLPKLPQKNLTEHISISKEGGSCSTPVTIKTDENSPTSASTMIAKLYAIEQQVLDRIEMHTNVGVQRNNWNNLLLTSINAITLAATTMAGIASMGTMETPFSLQLSSSLLFSAATGMLLIMNTIQPAQLAEEQRNAARLFKQLNGEIQTRLAIGSFTLFDLNDLVNKILALDKAFPLPLLGGVMLEKFPEAVEPSMWWPRTQTKRNTGYKEVVGRNGWNNELEEEMRGIVEVLKRKDAEEYTRLGMLVLKINKFLAISGPLLTGIAAAGSVFAGSNHHWVATIGVLAGTMASIVNTMEHGGQVGMVFEMYKNCGGYFQLLEETIEAALEENDRGRRENGELLEMKVALQLGRSLEELRDLATKSSRKDGDFKEFACKVF